MVLCDCMMLLMFYIMILFNSFGYFVYVFNRLRAVFYSLCFNALGQWMPQLF